MFKIYHAELVLFVTAALAGIDTARGRYLDTAYGVKMLDVDRQFPLSRGYGSKICLVGGGYDVSHMDLPSDPLLEDSAPATSHGTQVAGILAAVENRTVNDVAGVAVGASLVIGPYVDPNYFSGIAYALEKCKEVGANIVHLGFTLQGSSKCDPFNGYDPRLDTLLQNYFVNDDMLFIAGAGDHGDCPSPVNSEDRYPAAYSAVMSIGAVNDLGEEASFSAKASTVEMGAPGVDVLTTDLNDGFSSVSGTSFAAAHVAGAAAIVWGSMPWLPAPQLRTHLQNSATALPSNVHNMGHGLVDIGFFPISNKRSGKCLTQVTDTVYLRNCGPTEKGQAAPHWMYDAITGLVINNLGSCLQDNTPLGPDDDADLTVEACNKTSSKQQWLYDSSKQTLVSTQFTPGKCLTATGRTAVQNYELVSLETCGDGDDQRWPMRHGDDDRVLLCRNYNCLSGKYYAGPGEWERAPVQIGNDKLSKVFVPSGLALEMFQHDLHGNRDGWSYLVSGGDNGVELDFRNEYSWLNDQVSNFKVLEEPNEKVKFCEWPKGRYGDVYKVKPVYGDWEEMPDRFKPDNLPRVRKMDFIFLPRGYSIQYFDGDNFSGNSETKNACDNDTVVALKEESTIQGHDIRSFRIRPADCVLTFDCTSNPWVNCTEDVSEQ